MRQPTKEDTMTPPLYIPLYAWIIFVRLKTWYLLSLSLATFRSISYPSPKCAHGVLMLVHWFRALTISHLSRQNVNTHEFTLHIKLTCVYYFQRNYLKVLMWCYIDFSSLTPCCRVFLSQLTTTQMVKKIPAFMDLKRSRSRYWAYPEPHESISYHHTLFL
jgi:hypothetical protein